MAKVDIVRVSDLSLNLVPTAVKTWQRNYCPGQYEYWYRNLYDYTSTILYALENNGAYPLVNDWYNYDEHIIHYDVCDYHLDFNDPYYCFSVAMPGRWKIFTPLDISAADVPCPDFYNYLVSDVLWHDKWFQQYDLHNFNKYIVEPAIQVLEDYMYSHVVNVFDVDRTGGYAFLLFWSDTGEMLTREEAEEWWCNNSLEEIALKFPDILGAYIMADDDKMKVGV